ncbi:MAG: hypothetical protein AAFO82_00615 [Bacteroidota bacterium]
MKFTHQLVMLLLCTATCFALYGETNSSYFSDSIDHVTTDLTLPSGEVNVVNALLASDRTGTDEKVDVQLIQNVPATTFDLYLDQELMVKDFDFRTATPFLSFPKGKPFRLGLAPTNSTSYLEVTEYFSFNLNEELPCLLFIHYDEIEGKTLMQLRNRVPQHKGQNELSISFAHGVFDMSPVDVFINGVRKFSNVGAGEITPYLSIASKSFQMDLRSIYTGETLHSYQADFTNVLGESAVIYTSGFAENGRIPLSMQVTLSNSTTFSLPMQGEEIVASEVPKSASVKVEKQYLEEEEKLEEVVSAKGIVYDAPTQVFVEKKTVDVIVVLEKANSVSIKLINDAGEVVEEQTADSLEQGKYFFDIRKKYLKKELHFLQIWIGDQLYSHQVSISK